MKKVLNMAILVILLLTTIPLLANSSVDISFGASVRYTEWMPPWINGMKKFSAYFPSGETSRQPHTLPLKINKFKFDPEHKFLYGGALSISFLKRWSISSSFAIGSFQAVSKGAVLDNIILLLNLGDFPFYFIHTMYEKEILKYDSDSLISCRVHDYVKIFIGFKYQGYKYDEKLFFLVKGGTSGFYGKGKANFINYGPGLGFGLTIPLGKSFFLLYNISGSILIGSAEYDYKYALLIPNLKLVGRYDDEHFYSYCGNTSLSLAYYIEAASITLALGGRYQVLYFKQKNKKLQGFLDYNNKYDHFYGGTITVLYSFKIGGKKRKKI